MVSVYSRDSRHPALPVRSFAHDSTLLIHDRFPIGFWPGWKHPEPSYAIQSRLRERLAEASACCCDQRPTIARLAIHKIPRLGSHAAKGLRDQPPRRAPRSVPDICQSQNPGK